VLLAKDSNKEAPPEVKIPRAYSDAVNSLEGKFWKDAMDYELNKLEEMNTWDKIDLKGIPDNAQVLPGMWVHTIKNFESKDQKFRSRWVVQGDQQKTNISLSNTFAPVSHVSSLRVLLAFLTIKDLRIFTWDIDLAYLHGKIDHDIYIKFPDGYDKVGKVTKLNKALYSLPEVACVW